MGNAGRAGRRTTGSAGSTRTATAAGNRRTVAAGRRDRTHRGAAHVGPTAHRPARSGAAVAERVEVVVRAVRTAVVGAVRATVRGAAVGPVRAAAGRATGPTTGPDRDPTGPTGPTGGTGGTGGTAPGTEARPTEARPTEPRPGPARPAPGGTGGRVFAPGLAVPPGVAGVRVGVRVSGAGVVVPTARIVVLPVRPRGPGMAARRIVVVRVHRCHTLPVSAAARRGVAGGLPGRKVSGRGHCRAPPGVWPSMPAGSGRRAGAAMSDFRAKMLIAR